MPTLIGANRAFCGEFQTMVGMPAGSALRLPCRRRHGNRYLLIAVERSKLLPFGSALDSERLAEISHAVRMALRFAFEHRPITFDDAARERWIDAYRELTADRPGLAGAAAARAEAHTVRLALTYALLDLSERICPEHLEAALAVWRYSAASAHWIFGDALGDPTADELWSAAKERPAGLTRTEVLRTVQPQQETPRDRTRALSARARRTATTRNPPGRARPRRRGVDPRAHPRRLTGSRATRRATSRACGVTSARPTEARDHDPRVP